MTGLVVLEGCAIALLGLLVVGLLRSHAEILRRLHELGAGVGDPGGSAPGRTADVAISVRPGLAHPPERLPAARDVVGVTPAEEAAAVAVTAAGHDTLLAFLSTGCSTCAGFWRAFAAPGGPVLPAGVRLVVVTKGLEMESLPALRELAPPAVTVVASTQAWTDYDVPVAPYFVHVAAGRVTGAGAAASWEQVARLFAEATGDVPVADSRDNVDRVDAELLAAGIGPGHPSLYGAGAE